MKVFDITALASTVSGSRSSIADLPPEILLMIFKFVFVATRHPTQLRLPCSETNREAESECTCDEIPDGDYPRTGDSKSSPFSQFPNSVASVCLRWEEIMLGIPAFWTRIVIHLDADIPSPLKLQRQLCASGNQPIDVAVTRASFSDAPGLKDIEQRHMVQIITALRSHIHRCRTLKFAVIHTSSLPCLFATLPPKMPYIQKLLLESCIDSGRPEVQPYSQVNHARSINWRKLRTVHIDGWNFAELYRRTPKPNQQIFSACRSLSIKYGGDGFSSSSIMRLATTCPLRSLEVESVNFGMGDEPQDDSFISSLTLRNLSAEATDVMLGVCNSVNELTIDNCPSTLTTRLPTTVAVNLKNIDSYQSLRDFIRMWDGTSFRIIKCPGFNDEILKLMGRMSRNVPNSHLSGMEDLFIRNCYGFTLDALKQLVLTRFSNDMMFQTLNVAKCGSTISDDDLTWFRDRVSQFRWRV